jgi:hypothetical protein
MQNLQVFAWLIGLSPIRGSLNAYFPITYLFPVENNPFITIL